MGDERAGVSVQRRGDVEMLAVLDEAQQLQDCGELSHPTARAIEQVGEGRVYVVDDVWTKDAGAVGHLGHHAQPAFTIRCAHPGTDSAIVPAKHRRPGGSDAERTCGVLQSGAQPATAFGSAVVIPSPQRRLRAVGRRLRPG